MLTVHINSSSFVYRYPKAAAAISERNGGASAARVVVTQKHWEEKERAAALGRPPLFNQMVGKVNCTV
jgi:hypothetical protein